VTRPLRRFASAKFLRFLFAGGVAALANILSRVALSGWIAYVPSIMVAYLIGMVTAYLLNRIMVFGAGDRGVSGEVVWFVIVNALAVLQTLIVSVGLAWYVLPALGITSHDETIAHVVGVIVPVFTSYLGHKHWTFRNHVKA
jgi:putative flippase GtrA